MVLSDMQGEIMNEREAFIRSICERPEDDTVRLVFADWLEEHEEPESTCPKCEGKRQIYTGMDGMKWVPCNECGGRGYIGDVTNANRAEFIRLGIERSHVETWDGRPELLDMMSRQNRLLESNADRWSPWRGGDSVPKAYRVEMGDTLTWGDGTVFVFERGFAVRIRSTCRAFIDNSFMFLTHPIEHVRFTDKEPLQNSGGWHWERAEHDTQVSPSVLPRAIFEKLPVSRGEDGELADECRGYPCEYRDGEHTALAYLTPGRAFTALSRAWVSWGRNLAGLPSFTQTEMVH